VRWLVAPRSALVGLRERGEGEEQVNLKKTQAVAGLTVEGGGGGILVESGEGGVCFRCLEAVKWHRGR
jgi:hypothetical protein